MWTRDGVLGGGGGGDWVVNNEDTVRGIVLMTVPFEHEGRSHHFKMCRPSPVPNYSVFLFIHHLERLGTAFPFSFILVTSSSGVVIMFYCPNNPNILLKNSIVNNTIIIIINIFNDTIISLSFERQGVHLV